MSGWSSPRCTTVRTSSLLGLARQGAHHAEAGEPDPFAVADRAELEAQPVALSHLVDHLLAFPALDLAVREQGEGLEAQQLAQPAEEIRSDAGGRSHRGDLRGFGADQLNLDLHRLALAIEGPDGRRDPGERRRGCRAPRSYCASGSSSTEPCTESSGRTTVSASKNGLALQIEDHQTDRRIRLGGSGGRLCGVARAGLRAQAGHRPPVRPGGGTRRRAGLRTGCRGAGACAVATPASAAPSVQTDQATVRAIIGQRSENQTSRLASTIITTAMSACGNS
jgi:hypothetical protein